MAAVELQPYGDAAKWHGSRNGHQTSDDSLLDDAPLIADGSEYVSDEEGQWRRRPARRYGSLSWTDQISGYSEKCFSGLRTRFRRKNNYKPRDINLGEEFTDDCPQNAIKNQKYNVITFIPLVLYEQFKFFLNLYFLIVALSQFIPALRIGYLYTYWAPLGFVLGVTMAREAFDDCKRFWRDREVNGQLYCKLTRAGKVSIPSADIRVGDLIVIEKNQRVPADIVLLRTTEANGSCFIRTDQLDGETDWKLRLAVLTTQGLTSDNELLSIQASVYAEAPKKDIHSFIGKYTNKEDGEGTEEPLSVDNVLWASTVLASGTAIGLVVYTGSETRSVMNTSQPSTKVGLLDLEINRLTKILFVATMILAFTLVALKGFNSVWYLSLFRFILLFSYIIPISLRVNLDMGKLVYSWMIQRDKKIPDTIVRNSTIPEELGRIVYLLSDKTGTLTQNEMVFKRLHVGSVSYGSEMMNEVSAHVRDWWNSSQEKGTLSQKFGQRRFNTMIHVGEAVKACALCHNVTPISDNDTQNGAVCGSNSEAESSRRTSVEQQGVTYQASSPDEVALVQWSATVGLPLIDRDLSSISLCGPDGGIVKYLILQIFPFTSERKRMGIILKDTLTGEIVFYMKGADVIMSQIVKYNDWLEEECGNMAREGLRILVVAKKALTTEQFRDFEVRYKHAKLSLSDRAAKVETVVQSIEHDMELLCLTGVEDKLQQDVKPTLELLRNAGIKTWMLTGDKMETAICIATSAKLVSKDHAIHCFPEVCDRQQVHLQLNEFRRKSDCALVITGTALEVCLTHYEGEFIELACQSPAVVCCRCSPTQKARVVELLKKYTHKPTCAVGDGGNDVSMIQAADAGIGIVGKEGKQASLAADFSITQFKHIGRLLVWHGRNSYKRSASLGQFVMHRGLIISVMQAIFSTVFYFVSIALYEGYLMVGYATVYTMFPVFSLVLDEDVSADTALMYPELYKDLAKSRSLSFKTFFMWILISIYQGGVIMYGALVLFDDEFIHIVAITFTSLILTELLMVALTIRTWHWVMIVAELLSLGFYVASLAVPNTYFDASFLKTWGFVWRVLVITLVSCLPLYILKYLRRRYAPPSYSKLQK